MMIDYKNKTKFSCDFILIQTSFYFRNFNNKILYVLNNRYKPKCVRKARMDESDDG